MRTSMPETESGSPQWMVSFADLLSLILTFFVLIYSMANPMQMTNIFKNQYNSVLQNESDIIFSEIEMETDSAVNSSAYLKNIFKNKIGGDKELQALGINSKDGKFFISVPFGSLTDGRIEKIADFIRPFEREKHIYASQLDNSKIIADKLERLGVSDGLGFYQKPGLQDRIDIIIYP